VLAEPVAPALEQLLQPLARPPPDRAVVPGAGQHAVTEAAERSRTIMDAQRSRTIMGADHLMIIDRLADIPPDACGRTR
jgi:hypothetical protein